MEGWNPHRLSTILGETQQPSPIKYYNNVPYVKKSCTGFEFCTCSTVKQCQVMQSTDFCEYVIRGSGSYVRAFRGHSVQRMADSDSIKRYGYSSDPNATTWRCSRLRLNCDGTRTETRFRLSAKRTSPFKLAWASV